MLPKVLAAMLTVLALSADAESRGAETFSNPIIPGFAPDPSIVRVGSDFYVVNSSFEYFPGIPIHHSRDLINWELIGYALHDPDQVDLDTISSGSGIHASTIRYRDGLFYVITTNNIDGELVNFVVTAEDPRGPWSDAIVIEGAPISENRPPLQKSKIRPHCSLRDSTAARNPASLLPVSGALVSPT